MVKKIIKENLHDFNEMEAKIIEFTSSIKNAIR